MVIAGVWLAGGYKSLQLPAKQQRSQRDHRLLGLTKLCTNTRLLRKEI